MNQRIVIVGGPRTGKSTLARGLRSEGLPTFCGDPASLAKEIEPGVTYLPERFAAKSEWSNGSAYVAENWLAAPGPWCCEGVVMARALRKFSGPPPDRIIVIANHCPLTPVESGQAAMHKGVMTVWREIAARFAGAAEVWAWKLDAARRDRENFEATATLRRVDLEAPRPDAAEEVLAA